MANFCVIAIALLINRYQTQFRLAEERISGLAAVYEENALLLMGNLEGIMRATREDVRSDVEGERLDQFLKGTAARLPQLRTLLVLDREGVTVADSRLGEPAIGIDVSDRNYFVVHTVAQSEAIFIDQPVQSRVDGDWSLPISLGSWGEEGQLENVIVASIDPIYFSRSLSSFGFDEPTTGYILNNDDIVLTTIPYDSEIIGRTAQTEMIRTQLTEGRRSGIYQGVNLVGDDTHLIAYRYMDEYQYVIAFMVSRSAILRVYFLEAAVIVLMLILLSSVTYVISRRLLSRTQEVEAAHNQLEEQENILTLSLQAAGAGVWVWEMASGRIDWDDTIEQIHGLEMGSFGGDYASWQACVHPEDLHGIEAILQECVTNDLPFDEEFRIVRPDNEVRYILAQAVVLRDTVNGAKDKMVGVNIDITTRKLAEERRREAERLRLEIAYEREIVDLKQHFVISATHDFRTPLQNIMINANLLQRFHDQWPSDRQVDKLQQIQEQVEQMTSLLNDVLTWSKIRASGMELSLSEIVLETFCQQIWDVLSTIDEGKHKASFQFLASVKQLRADKTLLQQILVNLLSNAFKYTPEGKRVDFTVMSENGCVTFQVRDEGIGIPAADQTRLFQPFHRASNVGDFQGTGLGLSIVKEYVELHHGTIMVDSEEGMGTTFTVQIPHGG